jgi:hypothetical protein
LKHVFFLLIFVPPIAVSRDIGRFDNSQRKKFEFVSGRGANPRKNVPGFFERTDLVTSRLEHSGKNILKLEPF